MGWLTGWFDGKGKKRSSTTQSKKKSRKPNSKTKRHHVYVVELDSAVLNEKRFNAANPNYRKGKKCYYVGMTGLSPEQRFENHKKGHKSNKYAHRYGLRLRPRIYSKFNPMSYSDAQKKEVELAQTLQKMGHAVWQN